MKKVLILITTIVSILIISMIMPTSLVGKSVEAKASFGIKGYRHSNASLIEWTKVNGASWYKVYRAIKKKGKKAKYTKFKKIGTVSENWFTKYGDNILKTRWFVNVCYDGRKKCPQKGHRYNHKKTYKYKVVALKGKDIVSKSTIITVKKYKSKKYEPGYDVFYYANKERYKAKKRVLPWGHVLEKGTKKRAIDNNFRIKRGDNLSNKKNGKYLAHIRPKERLTSAERKYNGDSTWIYLRIISQNSLTACDVSHHRENVSIGYLYGHGIIKAYMKSPGHKEALLSSQDNFGLYCSFISYSPKVEVTVLNSPGIIIGTNYDNLATEKERQVQDKNSKVISRVYKPLLDNAYKYIQSNVNQGMDAGGYLDFNFTKSDLSKCKTLYPWATDNLLNQYFNNTTYSYYKTESYWEYDDNGIQREHKYSTIKSEYKNKVNQLYVNFVKNYAKLIPYK